MQTTTNPQQLGKNAKQIKVKGAEKAKKKPPKLVEKVIDKVEEMLTKPADDPGKLSFPQPQEQQTQPQKPPPTAMPEEPVQPAQTQREITEVLLPAGTTITLPDGKSFETKTESILKKGGGDK